MTAEKHEVKDHSPNTLRRQVRESRDLLGPYLKLYQIHSATLESGVLDNRDVLNELAELHDSGLKVGLSLSGPIQGEALYRALDVTSRVSSPSRAVRTSLPIPDGRTACSQRTALFHRYQRIVRRFYPTEINIHPVGKGSATSSR